MEFVEISGKVLLHLLHEDEIPQDDLIKSGLTDSARVRINRQGDIEIFEGGDWNVIGGLLGDFKHRLEQVEGLEWKISDP